MSLLMFVPIVSYVALMLAVRTGRLVAVYLFAAVTLATTILGLVSISLITPLNFAATDLRGWVLNILAAVYVCAMIYGSFAARSGNTERLITGGIFVTIVALVSAVI
jgi:hypothetical protein